MPQALVYGTRYKFMLTGISLCFKNNEKLPNNKNQIEKIQRCRSASSCLKNSEIFENIFCCSNLFFSTKLQKKREKERKRKIWIITLNYVTIFKQCWLLWWKRKTFHLCFTKYSKVKRVAFYHCWVLLLSFLSILILQLTQLYLIKKNWQAKMITI